ncbi:unnamed protein product [Alopecurus aequalis]
MDQFPDGRHVWLRSRVHGTYLHADEDGHGVSLSSRRRSMKAAWVVHRFYADAQHVLLHSAAYGRYLAATGASAPHGCRGFRVEQRNYDEIEGGAIRWQPIRFRTGDNIVLRHAAGHRYGYLRANGRYLPWNEDVVSVDDFDNVSTMMEWVVKPIPTSDRVPRLPRPNRVSSPCPLLDSSRITFGILRGRSIERIGSCILLICSGISPRGLQVLHLLLTGSFPALLQSRQVLLMVNGEDVAFVFGGRSVFRLRIEVARQLGFMGDIPNNLGLYVRAGTFGRYTPLVVDLPSSVQRLAITAEVPANFEHLYPDFDAV